MHSYQHKIKQAVASRGISQLYHFTPAKNARSILCNGLASRDILLESGVDFLATDSKRLDDRLDAVSISIHSINKDMLKNKMDNYAGEWLIFELDASILWTHSCRFCWDNAAKSEVRRHKGFLGGEWGFTKMFDDKPVSLRDDRSYRIASKLEDYEPTNNAAEVQVLDPISAELIVGVSVQNFRMKDNLESLMQEIDFVRPVVVCESFLL